MKSLALTIVLVHFLVDWVLQSRFEAENKSKRLDVLAWHMLMNFLGYAWLPLVWPTIPLWAVAANTLTHGVIDWNIWRIYKRANRHQPAEFMTHNMYARDYWFYATIAIDQAAHLMIAIALFL